MKHNNAMEFRDYDMNGSLMTEIEKTLAAPVFSGGKRQTAASETRWKSANSQYCSACNEGGELLCCDRCPASFHLICHVPPINVEQIPEGRWLCNRCVCHPRLQETYLTTVVRHNNNNSIEKPGNGDVLAQSGPKDTPDAISKAKTVSAPAGGESRQLAGLSEEMRNAVAIWATSARRAASPDLSTAAAARLLLRALDEAVQTANAAEFALPPEMLRQNQLPGCEKWPSPGNVSDRGRRLPHEADQNGVIPRPTKICFTCNKSSRESPLVQCDYCPLLFHGECLNPPLLGSVPKDKWMCPAHVEHALDAKLLKSVSFTERLNLWEKYARRPVNEQVVKVRFLARAGRHHPPFRLKLSRPAARRPLPVPPAVRDLYRTGVARPAPEVPGERPTTSALSSDERRTCDLLGLEDQTKDALGDTVKPDAINGDSAGVRTLDNGVDRAKRQPPKPRCPSRTGVFQPNVPVDFDGLPDNGLAENVPAPECRPPATEDIRRKRNFSDSREAPTGLVVNGFTAKRQKRSLTLDQYEAAELERALTALNRPKGVDVHTQTDGWHDETDAELCGLDEKTVMLLAKQRLRQLRPPPALRVDLSDQRDFDPEALAPHKPVLAVIQPPSGAPFPVQRAFVSIGARGCHLDLTKPRRPPLPRCARLSHYHAAVVLNRAEGRFELINYGEYGTEVDGVLYASDHRLSERRGRADPAFAREPEASVRTLLRDVASSLQPDPGDSLQLFGSSANADKVYAANGAAVCGCAAVTRRGWEGSALLRHGSLIRIGCLRLVFALAAYPTDAREASDHLPNCS